METRGISTRYEDWAQGVAADEQVQALIESLPRQKWQPNLIFASARWNGAPLSAYSDFREWLVMHWDAVAATATSRFTQTNEAGRCSLLLPEVVWRGGIDLAPIDVEDSDAMKWLDTLVWPEHEERRLLLKAAAKLVAEDPPLLVTGDLNEEVRRLAAAAPDGATLVVFHSAVLAYLREDERAQFVAEVQSLDAVWLSNEASGVLADVRSKLPVGIDSRGDFIVARDGDPVALAGGHGQFYLPLREG